MLLIPPGRTRSVSARRIAHCPAAGPAGGGTCLRPGARGRKGPRANWKENRSHFTPLLPPAPTQRPFFLRPSL